MAAAKTRGPRTPDERATDAARSSATRFETLPSSDFADEYLKPFAVLLRFLTGTSYLEPGPRLDDLRRTDEVEHQFLEMERELYDLAEQVEHDAELMPLSRGARKAQRLSESLRRDLREQKARIAAALAEGDEDDPRG